MNCHPYKLREANFLERQMGLLPEARLKPAAAFNHIILDLFGPCMVRREVQKRTSAKAYGVMFTDLAVRAVHIERCLNITQAIFRWLSTGLQVSVDYSDPGSQLVGVERELKEVWKKIDRKRKSLQRISAQN